MTINPPTPDDIERSKKAIHEAYANPDQAQPMSVLSELCQHSTNTMRAEFSEFVSLSQTSKAGSMGRTDPVFDIDMEPNELGGMTTTIRLITGPEIRPGQTPFDPPAQTRTFVAGIAYLCAVGVVLGKQGTSVDNAITQGNRGRR